MERRVVVAGTITRSRDVFHVRSAKDTVTLRYTRSRNGRVILGLGISLNTKTVRFTNKARQIRLWAARVITGFGTSLITALSLSLSLAAEQLARLLSSPRASIVRRVLLYSSTDTHTFRMMRSPDKAWNMLSPATVRFSRWIVFASAIKTGDNENCNYTWREFSSTKPKTCYLYNLTCAHAHARTCVIHISFNRRMKNMHFSEQVVLR